MVLTRAAGQASSLGHKLEDLGARVIYFPTIALCEPESWAPLDRALANLSDYDWLVFTSANAVGFFIGRAREKGISDAVLHGLRIGAVGSATRSALEAHGLTVVLQPREFSGESLVDELRDRAPSAESRSGFRVLVPSSNLARAEIWEPLCAEGIVVDVVEAYRNVPVDHSNEDVLRMFAAANRGYIVFASPSSIVNLSKLARTEDLSTAFAGSKVICIGPTTAEAASRHGIRQFLEPEEASATAIVKLITENG